MLQEDVKFRFKSSDLKEETHFIGYKRKTALYTFKLKSYIDLHKILMYAEEKNNLRTRVIWNQVMIFSLPQNFHMNTPDHSHLSPHLKRPHNYTHTLTSIYLQKHVRVFTHRDKNRRIFKHIFLPPFCKVEFQKQKKKICVRYRTFSDEGVAKACSE